MPAGATSDGNHVFGNQMTASTEAGITVNGSSNTVENNNVVSNQANGIVVVGTLSPSPNVTPHDNLVRNNSVSGNATVLTGSASIFIGNALRTTVSGNTVVGTGSGPGTFVGANSSSTVVSSNQLYNNQDGLLMNSGASNTFVFGNVAVQNTRDGFRIGFPQATPNTVLQGNTAYANANYGIEAAPGTIDGGGNRAFANGNPQQCTPNIVCS